MTVVNLQVGATSDDSSTLNSSFAFNFAEAASIVGNSAGNTGQIWDRWTSVTIPQGTTLTSAIISLYNVTGHGAGSSIVITSKAENADNHTAPTSGADANGRTLTTGTAWPTFGPSVDNTWYTQDIVAEIQTVINRAGWASGNAIGVRTIDAGSGANSNLNVRNWDNDPTKAAKLDITYGGAGGPFPFHFDELSGGLSTFGLGAI